MVWWWHKAENILMIEAACPWWSCSLTMCIAAADLLHGENLPELRKQHNLSFTLSSGLRTLHEKKWYSQRMLLSFKDLQTSGFRVSEANVISTGPHSHPERQQSQSQVSQDNICLHLSSNPERPFLSAHDLMMV